jgi:hypothetical protein
MKREYQTFRAFWPFYLTQHSHPLNRRFHFVGTTLVNVTAIAALVQGRPLWLLACPLFGYGWAWVGHFIIEKNRPATFTYPLWSLMGDYKMYGRMLRGQLWG